MKYPLLSNSLFTGLFLLWAVLLAAQPAYTTVKTTSTRNAKDYDKAMTIGEVEVLVLKNRVVVPNG